MSEKELSDPDSKQQHALLFNLMQGYLTTMKDGIQSQKKG